MGSLFGMSGVSMMLTLSLITLITIECLKTNQVENYVELENSQSDWKNTTNQFKNQIHEYEEDWINRVNKSEPTKKQLEEIGSSPPGEFPFVKPYNNYNKDGNSVSVTSDSNDRSKNIGLCAQNYNTFGVSTLGQPAMNGVASSLLPQSAKGDKSTVKGFEDCDNKNVLASQFLLTDTQIGIDTTMGSKKDQLYDLRTAPANPHDYVGIWGLSTKYENLERRPLEDSTALLHKDFNRADKNNDKNINLNEFEDYYK